MSEVPVGEMPELPVSLIDALHQRWHQACAHTADRAWDAAAIAAVSLFEGWRRAP